MNKFLFAALLCFAYFHHYSQTPAMASGNIIDRKDFKQNEMGYTHFLRNSVYLDGSKPSNVFFDLKTQTAFVGLDTDEKKQYRLGILKNYVDFSGTKTLNAEVPGLRSETYKLEGIFEIKGRKFVFYTAQSSNERALYVNELSESFVLLGSPIRLLSPESGKNLAVILSENKRSLLVLQVDADSKAPMAISCNVFDENLGEVWKRNFEIAEHEKELQLRAADIDDAGNVYFLTYGGKEKNQRASLHHYFWKAKEYKQTVLAKQGERTYGCYLKILRGTHPAVAGLYLQENKLGYFLTRVDAEKRQVTEIFSKMLPESYTELMKNVYQPGFFGVDQMTMTDDSHIAFSVEGNIERVKDNVFYTYFSGSMLLESVDSTGKTQWQKIIYKRQSVPGIPFTTSHALFANGNEVHVVYNDHRNNFSLSEDDDDVKEFTGVKVSVVVQSIDAGGKMSKRSVVTGKPEEFGINPKYMIKIQDGLHQTQLWSLKGMKVLFCYSTFNIK